LSSSISARLFHAGRALVVLRDVSLSLAAQNAAILGPSGSAKHTAVHHRTLDAPSGAVCV